MKKTSLLSLISFFILVLGYRAEAQVTNLTVNGVSSNFTFVQGDALTWEFNLPVGGTASCEIWIDIDGNGVIDPLIDKSVFGVIPQTDGQPGINGPADMDSTVNGHIILVVPDFGLAPAKYVFRFTNNGVGESIAGTVTPVVSPAFTVSGTVTPPPSISAKNILIAAQQIKGPGWFALTDISGSYAINFNASAGGADWSIQVNDVFASYVVTPKNTIITLSQNYSGINFSFAQAAANVVGYFTGDDGHVFANAQVGSYPYNNSGDQNGKTTMTDANGFFQFSYSLDEITSSPNWGVQAQSAGIVPAYFPPRSSSSAITIHENDSIRFDLKAYVTNDSITGKITVNGKVPNAISFSISANSEDSGYTVSNSDPTTGNFTLYVSKKIYGYYLGIDNQSLPSGYYYSNQIQAYLGDKNIIFNLTDTTGLTTIIVKSDASTLAAGLGSGIPSQELQTSLDSANTSGLVFASAAVGNFGTGTSIPQDAPQGTQVINIAPGDGENGYFKVTFSLPTIFSQISLLGEANIDDVGRVFLNGNPISPSIMSNDPLLITEGTSSPFTTSNAAFFKTGTNELLFSDANIGGGPSGAAFYAIITFSPVPLDVLKQDRKIPSQYALYQNYPNPFNPSTVIAFSLPSKSFVSLKVFDILGKEIATIVSEELSAGNYSRQWNAAMMSSGIYFYRLQAGTFTETKKLILLR